MGELNKTKIVITASGNALTKAVSSAEVIKRRFKGLHQITKIESIEVVDEYEPLEEGLDKVTDTRTMPFMQITLSKEALDPSALGYQAPIDESLVKEWDPEEEEKRREEGRERRKTKGEGRAKSKGKGGEKEKTRAKARAKEKE